MNNDQVMCWYGDVYKSQNCHCEAKKKWYYQEIGNTRKNRVKFTSQYIARNALRPKVVMFSMGFDTSRRRNRIYFYSCVATHPNSIENPVATHRVQYL